MYRVAKMIFSVSAFLAFCLSAGSAALGDSGRASEAVRRGDVVSFRGEAVPDLLGTPIDRIGGFAYKEGRLEAVPFQVDERDRKGELIYTTYAGGTTAVRDGVLDGRDEIIFMAQDAGARWGDESFPLAAVGGSEVKITDPLEVPDSWFYLFRFEGCAPRSEVDYVGYDPGRDWVKARYYTVGFPYRKAIQVPSYFSLSEEGGGNGVNIYDLYKIRLTIDLKLFGTISRSQDDFISKPVGYVDGPVRVSRRVRSALRLAGPIRSAMLYNDSCYYPYYCSFPSLLQIPFRMKFIARSASLRITDDLSDGAMGMMWYNDRNTGGIEFTGKPSGEEMKLDRGPFRWKMADGPQGTILTLMLFDPKLKDLKKGLYFCDDETVADEPEQFPGQIGNQGYELTNLESVPKGEYKLAVYVFCPVNYEKGDEEIYLNSILNPLTVSAKPLPRNQGIMAKKQVTRNNNQAISKFK